MILSVQDQTQVKQVEFYVIKDSNAVSDSTSVQTPTDPFFIYSQVEPQSVSDSIFQILVSPLHFTVKQDTGYRYEAKLKAQYIQNWSIIILVFLFVILASIRTSSDKYIIQLFQSIFNRGTAARLFRDKMSTLMHVSFRLDTLFILIIGLYFFQAVNYFEEFTPGNSLIFFALSVFALLVYVTMKFMFYRISGFIFDANIEIKEYIFYTKSGNRIMGLIMFPIVLPLFFLKGFYAGFFLISGGVVIAIVCIINIIIGMQLKANKVYSIFYMILYLCTLEILPLLLMWRIVWRT